MRTLLSLAILLVLVPVAAAKPPSPAGFVRIQKLSTELAKRYQELKKVEEKLSDISLGFQNASDEADLQAHLAAMEARDRWDAISSDVGDVIRSMSGGGSTDAKEAFDNARLQAHLARLEAGEKVGEASKELKSKWSEVRHEAVLESSRFVERLGGTLEKLKEQLKQ